MKRAVAAVALTVTIAACDRAAERATWDPGRYGAEHAGAVTMPWVYTSTFQAGEAVWPPGIRNPWAEAVGEGERFYIAFNCHGCHGALGGGGIGPPLARPDFIYGNDPAQIFQSVAQGRPMGMPAYGGKAPDEVLWKIAAYVRHLSAPGRPHPGGPAEPGAQDAGAAGEEGAEHEPGGVE